ncbi:MAG: C25 family cysteine peptidase, partial [Ignavibacteria bacterium]|nr:C25 family cysteine peptidase [Ignavibacteria bacterium]
MKNLFLMLFAVISALMLSAGEIKQTYYFNHPSIQTKGNFQVIGFDNCLITGITGEPALPYQSVRLLLPPGEKAVSIEFSGEELIQLSGSFQIYPRQASRPLSMPGNGTFIMNEKLYQTDFLYPSISTGQLTTQYLNGYAFALSTFTPVLVNPASGEVFVYQKVTIKITTESSAQSAEALNNLQSGETISRRIENFSQNQDMISKYPSPEKSLDDYHLLIITPNQFAGNFTDLTGFYLQEGVKSQVVTRETINTSGTGLDLAEKIRNYIIQEYQDHGVEYVLLGGDVEHIPYRGFYCYAVSGGGYEDYNIPADLYFSALDGNWNTDGDDRWGEPGEDDLLPELSIGRFSFSNVAELNNMIHKTLSYQNTPV